MAGCSLGLAACLEDCWESFLSVGGTSFKGAVNQLPSQTYPSPFEALVVVVEDYSLFLLVFDGFLLFPLTAVDAVPCFASLAIFVEEVLVTAL